MDIGALVQSGYVNGLPLHIADSDRSVFKIMTEEEYQSSSIQTIQGLLRTKHIIVTNRCDNHYRFDEKGLRTLRSNLNDAFTVQGSYICILSIEAVSRSIDSRQH